MAVSIDTVYQRVLTLANKEQRGYITPQEFNLLANQAQMEIFEQYFYDIDQYRRRPNNNHAYSDILSNLEEKISHFKRYDENVVLRNFGIKATEMGILKLSADQRTFSWGSNDRKLMNVPFDEHPYSALAAWFKTDEGMEIYSNIEKRLNS